MNDVMVVRREWRQATQGLSLGAKGLLVSLLEKAAFSGNPHITITIASIAPHLDNLRGRESFAAWMAELKLRRLVRERGSGRFAIAPGLWSIETRESPIWAGGKNVVVVPEPVP